MDAAKDDPPQDLVGSVLDGRYRIEQRLSQGGMGIVYRARHAVLDSALAVKVLLRPQGPEDQQRFLQEARAASLVRNPHVVDIIDVGFTPEGLAYMAMELIDGEDLSTLLARTGPLPWSRLAPMVLQLCDALAATHARGIVHRDIKPENCVVTEFNGAQDFVKLIDFGIAKDLAGNLDHNNRPRTVSGSVYGTAAYVAPEMLAGKLADHRVDIYALGILMYELLLGERPFVGDALSDILIGHLQHRPAPLRSKIPARVPQAVDALILRTLEKDPARRFQSMTELAEAIAATLDHQTLQTSIESGAVPTGSYLSALRREASRAHRPVPAAPRRNLQLLVRGAALLAVAAGVLVWLLLPRPLAPVRPEPVAPASALAEPLVAPRLPLSLAPPAAPSAPPPAQDPVVAATPTSEPKPVRLTAAAARKEIDRKIAAKARTCLAKHTRLIKGQQFPVHVEVEPSGAAKATATLATSPAARCIAELFRRHHFPANIGGLTLDHAFTP